MLSYLDIVKPLVNSGLYTRGLKIYLEGDVLSHKDMLLDFWRQYSVKGKYEAHTIKIPLVHLALSETKFPQASTAFEEVATCDCPYFQEYKQVCKHIIAVCASLENELRPTTKNNGPRPQHASLVDNIFEAQEDRNLRVAVNNFDYSLSKNLTQSQIADLLGKYIDKQSTTKILSGIEKIVDRHSGDYSIEKKMVLISTNSYINRVASDEWSHFWFKKIKSFDTSNQINFIVRMWKNYLAGEIVSLEIMDQYLPNLSLETKKEVLHNLKVDYPQSPDNWLKYVFVSKYTEWLETNYTELETTYLIQACELLPDHRDKYENLLLDNMRVWSDFLPAGEYDEVYKTFKQWQSRIGRSEQFEDALKYFKKQHKRKPKLIDILNSL